jgi:hypothetical protein
MSHLVDRLLEQALGEEASVRLQAIPLALESVVGHDGMISRELSFAEDEGQNRDEEVMPDDSEDLLSGAGPFRW